MARLAREERVILLCSRYEGVDQRLIGRCVDEAGPGIVADVQIDKAGVIRYKYIGPVTEESVQKTLLPLIAELNR